jgi:hypothetical protein
MQAQAVVAGAHGEGESTESTALRPCGSEGGSGRPRSEDGGCDDAGTDPTHHGGREILNTVVAEDNAIGQFDLA